MVSPFDEAALLYPWRHSDPRVNQLQVDIQAPVEAATALGEGSARDFFAHLVAGRTGVIWFCSSFATHRGGAATRHDSIPHRIVVLLSRTY